ncbi:hypothetical protein SAMD00023353_2101140 [Rosellinia necatrix]|uniref:Uncharacterized protein n=1 Tax=Rosellinia necatrix TaxID=77044 RepID=A0A1W2TFE5_ROSNE|nr:hypothetical protein SAMD00023353_2101140 [Rosellinia necatrix]
MSEIDADTIVVAVADAAYDAAHDVAYDAAQPGSGNNSTATIDNPVYSISAGLERESLAYEETMLSIINESLSRLNNVGSQLMGFRVALNHACKWCFVIGNGSVFTASIRLHRVGHMDVIAILFSFHNINASAMANHNIDPALPEGRLMEAPLAMSQATKSWFALQILHLMLACYGRVPFPDRVWFMEDGVDGSPPALLLPYTFNSQGDNNLRRRVSGSRKSIIKQLGEPMPPLLDVFNWEVESLEEGYFALDGEQGDDLEGVERGDDLEGVERGDDLEGVEREG